MKFIIGKKLEMSQRFREDGTVVPVTLVYAPATAVVQLKTKEKDGYSAVQIGAFPKKEKSLNKPEAGHLKGLSPYKVIKEFVLDSEGGYERGGEITISQFQTGEMVMVTGTTKGHGFQGVVKRHGFHGHPRSHGHKDQLRMPGSIGGSRGGRGHQEVLKGKRMGGHMGDEQVTVKNLEIIEIDLEKNILAIKGAVPGARNGILYIKKD
ncbi:MAG: 50S ribosomal protein L3 [bacterium]